MLALFQDVDAESGKAQIPGAVSGEIIKTELEFLQADLLHRNIQDRRKKYFTWCFTLVYFWHLRFFVFIYFLIFVYTRLRRKVQPTKNWCPTFTFLADFS